MRNEWFLGMSRRKTRDDQGGNAQAGCNNTADTDAARRFRPLSLVASSVPRQHRARVATVQRQLSQALRPVPVVTNVNFDTYGSIATRLLRTNFCDNDCGDRADSLFAIEDHVSSATTTSSYSEIAASMFSSDLPPRDLTSERALWDGVKPSWSENEVPGGVQQTGFEVVPRPIRCHSCLVVNAISNLTPRPSILWPPEGIEQTIRTRADAAEYHRSQLKLAGRAARKLLLCSDARLITCCPRQTGSLRAQTTRNEKAPSEQKSPCRTTETFAEVALSDDEPPGSDIQIQGGTTDEEEDLLCRDLEPRPAAYVQPPCSLHSADRQHQGGRRSLTQSSLCSTVLHSSLMEPSGSGELPAWASVAPEDKVDPPGASPKLDVSACGLFPGTILLHGSERFGATIRVSAVGKVEGVVLRGPGLWEQQEQSSDAMGAEMLDLLSPCRQGAEESTLMAGQGVSPLWSSRGASAAPAPRQLLSGRISRGELWPSTQAAFARVEGNEDEAAAEGMRAAEEEELSSALLPSGNELLGPKGVSGEEAMVSITIKNFGNKSIGNDKNDGDDEAEEERGKEGGEEVPVVAAGPGSATRQAGSGGIRDGQGGDGDKLRNAASGLAYLRPPELPPGTSPGRLLLPLAKGRSHPSGAPGFRELCTGELHNQGVGFKAACAFPSSQAPQNLLDPSALTQPGRLLSTPEQHQGGEEEGRDRKAAGPRAGSRGGTSISSLVCPSFIRGGFAGSGTSSTYQGALQHHSFHQPSTQLMQCIVEEMLQKQNAQPGPLSHRTLRGVSFKGGRFDETLLTGGEEEQLLLLPQGRASAITHQDPREARSMMETPDRAAAAAVGEPPSRNISHGAARGSYGHSTQWVNKNRQHADEERPPLAALLGVPDDEAQKGDLDFFLQTCGGGRRGCSSGDDALHHVSRARGMAVEAPPPPAPVTLRKEPQCDDEAPQDCSVELNRAEAPLHPVATAAVADDASRGGASAHQHAQVEVFSVALSETQALCLEAITNDHRRLVEGLRPHCSQCRGGGERRENDLWDPGAAAAQLNAAADCFAAEQQQQQQQQKHKHTKVGASTRPGSTFPEDEASSASSSSSSGRGDMHITRENLLIMTGVAALRQAASLLIDYGVEAACLYLRSVARETDASLGSRFAASSRLLDSGCRAAISWRRTTEDESCENSAKEGLLLRLVQEALGGGTNQAAADTSPLQQQQQQQQQQQRAAVIGSECVFPTLCRVLKHAGWRFISLESACRRAAAASTSRENSQPHWGERQGGSMPSLDSHHSDAPHDDTPFQVLDGCCHPGYLNRLLRGCGPVRVVLMTHGQAQELFFPSAGGDEAAAAASEAFPTVIEYAVEPPLLMVQQPRRGDGIPYTMDGTTSGSNPRRWGAECAQDASPIVRTSADVQDHPSVCVGGQHTSSPPSCIPRHMVLAVRAPASVMGAASGGGGGVIDQGGIDRGMRGYEDGRFQKEQQVIDETAAESLVGADAAEASTGGRSRQEEELRGRPWGRIRRTTLQPSSCLGPQLDEAPSHHGGGGGGEEESSRLLHQADGDDGGCRHGPSSVRASEGASHQQQRQHRGLQASGTDAQAGGHPMEGPPDCRHQDPHRQSPGEPAPGQQLQAVVTSRPGSYFRRHRRVFERVLAAVEREPFHGSVLERPLRHNEDISLPPSTAVCVWDTETLCSGHEREQRGGRGGGTEPGGLEDLVVEHGERALPLLACAYSSVVCIVEGSSGNREGGGGGGGCTVSAKAAAQLHLAASRCGLSSLQIIQTSASSAPSGAPGPLPTSVALCQVLQGHLSSLMMQPLMIHGVPMVLAEEEAPAEAFLSGFGCLNPFSCASLLARVGPSFSLAQQLEEVVQAVYGAAGEGAGGRHQQPLLPSVPQSLTLLAAQLARRRLTPPATAARLSGPNSQATERIHGRRQAAESICKEEQMGSSRNQPGPFLQGQQQQQQQQGIKRSSRWLNSASAAVSRAAENLRVRQQQQQQQPWQSRGQAQGPHEHPWTPQHQEEPPEEAGHMAQPFSREGPPPRDAEPVNSVHQSRRDCHHDENNAFGRFGYRRHHQQQPGVYGRRIDMAGETTERGRRSAWLQHGSAAPPPGGRSGGKAWNHRGAGVPGAVTRFGYISAAVSPAVGTSCPGGGDQHKHAKGPVCRAPAGRYVWQPEGSVFRSSAAPSAPPGVASSSLSAAGSSGSASLPRGRNQDRVFSSDATEAAAPEEPCRGLLGPLPRSLRCQSGQLGPRAGAAPSSAIGRRSSSSAAYSLLMPLGPEDGDEETDGACFERLLELPDGARGGGQGGSGRSTSYRDDSYRGNFTGRGGVPLSAVADDGGFGTEQHAEDGLLMGSGTTGWTGAEEHPPGGWCGHLQELLQQDASEEVDHGWGATEEDPRPQLSSNNSASAFGGHGSALSGERAALEEGWLEASGPRCPPPPPPPPHAWSDGSPPPLSAEILWHRQGLERAMNGSSGEAAGEQQQLQADSEAARRRWGGRRVNPSAQRAFAIGRQLVGKVSGVSSGAKRKAGTVREQQSGDSLGSLMRDERKNARQF